MHAALPQTLTVELLAAWITENAIDTKVDTKDHELTPAQIAEYEHQSSLASRELDKLKEVEKLFKEKIKDGTAPTPDYDPEPFTLVIPATIGTDVLKKQRENADKVILDGKVSENTTIYFIPWPERKWIIAFDIQGKEWSQFNRRMTDEEVQAHGALFSEEPLGGTLFNKDDLMIEKEFIKEEPTPKKRKRNTEDML